MCEPSVSVPLDEAVEVWSRAGLGEVRDSSAPPPISLYQLALPLEPEDFVVPTGTL